MKAFLGAMVLTLLAAATGVLTATELHRLNLDARLASPAQQASKLDDTTELVDPPIKQRVKYLHQDLRRVEPALSERI
jgi:hypothetical protein